MAVLLQTTNYSGQTASITLYAPTGHTIPYNSPSGTTINVGEQVLPYIYQDENPAMEYGVFSLYFSGANKTCEASQLTPPDGDGNQYRTIRIGNQVWMAENLRTTKFQDGSPIYYATNDGSWTASANTIPLYTYVNNNSGNTEIHGLLYNYAAVSGSTSANTTTNLCPVGWRVPELSDFQGLAVVFDPPIIIYDVPSLMYPGNEYWDGNGAQRNNKTGFNLIGSGRFNDNDWVEFKTNSYHRPTNEPYVLKTSDTNSLTTFSIIPRFDGASVKCIKN
jgi:uncharacterized protein (TIGR02145 family)